ncbi:MAG: hypothetical protein U1A78_33590 [Polyangia bacterium]
MNGAYRTAGPGRIAKGRPPLRLMLCQELGASIVIALSGCLLVVVVSLVIGAVRRQQDIEREAASRKAVPLFESELRLDMERADARTTASLFGRTCRMSSAGQPDCRPPEAAPAALSGESPNTGGGSRSNTASMGVVHRVPAPVRSSAELVGAEEGENTAGGASSNSAWAGVVHRSPEPERQVHPDEPEAAGSVERPRSKQRATTPRKAVGPKVPPRDGKQAKQPWAERCPPEVGPLDVPAVQP